MQILPYTKSLKILQKLEFFQYTTYLCLNIGYTHFLLRNNARNLFTIILPWGR